MKATLVSKYSESSDVTTYQFQTDRPLQWQAGQFIEYHLPHESPDDRGESRYFTISSAPHEKIVQITTRLAHQDGSSFKSALDSLMTGDQIEISDPMGEFVINQPEAHYIFIAGGIGITPFRSILLDLAQKQFPLNITLLYANRTEEVVFKTAIEELATQHPSFTTRYFIGDEQIQLTDIMSAAKQLGDENVNIYISGPKPMVGSFKQQLRDAGYKPEQIKTDYFPGYDS